MQDNNIRLTADDALPPIEGELTDEDLKQVSGGTCSMNGQNYQGNDNSQGNEQQPGFRSR